MNKSDSQFPDTRASLLLQLQEGGDNDAWQQFLAVYRPVIYRLARKRGLQDAEARYESAAEVSTLMETCLSHFQQQPAGAELPNHVLSLCQNEGRPKRRFSHSLKFYITGGILMTLLTSVILFGLAALLPNEDTEYSPGYSESKFQSIKIGESIASVETKIGKPLNVVLAKPYTSWLYAPDKHPKFAVNGEFPPMNHACNVITFDKEGKFGRSHGQRAGTTKRDGGNVILSGEIAHGGNTPGPLGLSSDVVKSLKQNKATMDEIRKRFGEPQAKYVSRATKWLVYSRSPSSSDYRQRMLGIDEQGRVCDKKSEFYWD